MIGRSPFDLIHADHRPTAMRRNVKVLEEGEAAPPVERRVIRRDGSVLLVEVSTMPTVFDGEPSVILIGRDVTARKRMEAQLIMADRLASIGRLAASVGHEINNPLAYVLGTLSLMRHDLEGSRLPPDLALRMTERLEVLQEGAERMRKIVSDLKTLARAEDVIDGSLDIARVLDVCIDMAAHEIRHRARLTKKYSPGLYVSGSEARLGQVFLNLLVNAGQAIPEGAAAEHEVRVTAYRTLGGHIGVEVRDTGVGIRHEDREHIFEPFFTTKASGTSSGLGLSICHHIVTTFGGTIEAQPNESGGTSLIVVLPASGPPAGSVLFRE
jgi:signal transduction histidine kinase